jgi:hypothetical protein
MKTEIACVLVILGKNTIKRSSSYYIFTMS